MFLLHVQGDGLTDRLVLVCELSFLCLQNFKGFTPSSPRCMRADSLSVSGKGSCMN